MKVAQIVVDARRRLLGDLLRSRRYLPLEQICERLAISPATARRDLIELQRTGKVRRTPGGALTDFSDKFPSFSERLAVQSIRKDELARKVLPLLLSGFTIYLDGGTTPYALARLLPEADIPGLKVVSNSLPVVEFLANSGVSLHIPGGDLVPRQSLLLGPRAVRELQSWKFDLAIFGAEGATRVGLWNSAPQVVALQKAAMKQSLQSIFLISSEKVGHRTKTFLSGWEKKIRLISDASFQQLATHGIPPSVVGEVIR